MFKQSSPAPELRYTCGWSAIKVIESPALTRNSPLFVICVNSPSYASWVGGTLTGYLIGSALPTPVQGSLGLGLYGMFTAILIPEIKKSSSVLCLASLSGLLYYLLTKLAVLPSGWNLIASILLASLTGSFLLPSTVREEIK